jgi:hypothetical protein
VHGCPRVRLGEHQQALLPGLRLHRTGETPEGRRLALVSRPVAEDAEPAPGHRAQDVLLPAVGRHLLQLVLAVAEEREVLVREPRQERLALLDLLLGKRRRRLLQVRDHRVRLRHHLGPVLDGRADVGEHPSYVVGDPLGLPDVVGQPVDLDVHPRLADRVLVRRRRADRHRVQRHQLAGPVALGVERRVQHQMGVPLLASQLHGE